MPAMPPASPRTRDMPRHLTEDNIEILVRTIDALSVATWDAVVKLQNSCALDGGFLFYLTVVPGHLTAKAMPVVSLSRVLL